MGGIRVNAPLTIEQLQQADNDVKYVRVQCVDLTNGVRHFVLSKDFFLSQLESERPSVSLFKGVLGHVGTSIGKGFLGASGEYLYVMDLSSLRSCPYAPGHASVMGWFEEKTPNPDVGGSLAYKVDICPRSILNRITEEARTSLGINFLVGYEIEFTLLHTLSPLTTVNDQPWCASGAMRTGAIETTALEDMVDATRASGIEVQMFHSEAASGQYEIVTGPLPPLQAADALVHTRETIYNVARKHGLYATLAPRIFSNGPGNGAHTHISIQSDDDSSKSASSPVLTKTQASFLASALAHLPALIALTLPTPASFKRVADGAWSGGTYVCWGSDNREAPVRLCNASSPSSRNFEFRVIDGTANPYLVLAGILGAGIEGVRSGMELNVQDHFEEKMPKDMTDEEKDEIGIRERLPLDLKDARDRFEKDEIVQRIFGTDFVRKYLSVNQVLADHLAGSSEEEALQKLVSSY